MISEEEMEKADPFSISARKIPGISNAVFNPNSKNFAMSKWCYDTPGTVNPQQVRVLCVERWVKHS